MKDDISGSLKDMAHIIDMAQGRAEVVMTSGSMLNEAHQEIERLRIERDQWRKVAHELRHGSWYEAKELYEQVVSSWGETQSQVFEERADEFTDVEITHLA